ncbi:partial tryptophanyl-tRNA synthetase, partial [uncultured bacterium]
ILMTSDIIIYKASKVPVGIDQAPHLELSREITRRFNHFYGEVFPEPQTLLTAIPKVLGTDGRKMSKSYNNSIFLSDPPEEIDKKIRTMMTDTARKLRTDAGNPDVCPLFLTFHTLYSNEETINWVREGCTKALIGCIECKKSVIPKVLASIEPVQKKRKELEADPARITAILDEGAKKASKVAQETMAHVRQAMGLE